MRRNKNGLIGGDGRVRISKKKRSGLRKFLRMLVSQILGVFQRGLPLTVDSFGLGIDVDFNPQQKAREERKAKIAKNERQHQQNLARAQHAGPSSASLAPTNPQRKREIERTLATTRSSTASLGRFDRKLEGEKKLKGVKRKVRDAYTISVHSKTHRTFRFSSSILRKALQRRRNLITWQFYQN